MRNYFILFIGCLLFHLAGTWSLPLIDRDEPRFAETAREMSERGDFVVPFFNNQFRFDKPPLTYWFQAASYRIFGETDFAARFPTAVAAALVALVLFAWGMRLGNASIACWAAIIFSLSLQTFIHGKAAVADMWLVLFVTLAHWSAWRLMNEKPSTMAGSTTLLLVFYFSLALAFLSKGPIGWTPLLTVAIAQRFHGRENFRVSFKFVRGILLTFGLVCLWGIPALVRTHGEFFRIGIGKHVVERSIASMEGHGASSVWMYLALLPFYFITVFASFFPWSIKLPALWKKLRADQDETDQFLLIGAFVIFGIFTFVQTKLPHYTLPAFPLLALLLARRFESLKLSRALPIATAALFLAFALFATPSLAKFFPSYNLGKDSRPNLKPEMEFGAVEFTEPSLVWYFRSQIHGFMTPLNRKEAGEFMDRAGSRFIVMPTKSVPEIFPVIDGAWHTYRTSGFNIPKGRRVDLTMLLKPD